MSGKEIIRGGKCIKCNGMLQKEYSDNYSTVYDDLPFGPSIWKCVKCDFKISSHDPFTIYTVSLPEVEAIG